MLQIVSVWHSALKFHRENVHIRHTDSSYSGLRNLIDFYALFSAHQYRCQQPLTVLMILFIKIGIDTEHF